MSRCIAAPGCASERPSWTLPRTLPWDATGYSEMVGRSKCLILHAALSPPRSRARKAGPGRLLRRRSRAARAVRQRAGSAPTETVSWSRRGMGLAGGGPRGEDLMDRIRIRGGAPLHGTIPISGAKNAALPLMIASLLTDETLELVNVPRLADISSLLRILSNHGVDHTIAGKRPGQTTETGQTIRLSARTIIDTTAPYELVSTMRASFWVVAPLLARLGEAKVSMPGGCAIGTRPVDLLIMALERLGAEIQIEAGYVLAKAPKGLQGGEIVFPKVTVGGTHVALMAATLADGTTVIENAAREPEVVDLASCLTKMGARIEGAGSPRIVVEGVSRLHGTSHDVLPDRIETGTYAMAVAMTGGEVTLQNTRPELLESALAVLGQAGAEVAAVNEGICIRRNGGGLAAVDVTTDPF